MKKYLAMASIMALLTAGAAGCSFSAPGDSASSNSSAASEATITLGDTIKIDGSGATVDGSNLIIESAGTYNISGSLKDGMIKVDAKNETVNLVLDGVSIFNSDGPAILFEKVEEGILTLKDGSTNTLADGGSSDYDAALYSDGTLTINGSGSLKVDANSNEGISSTMHINIEDGNIRVIAVEDGLNANNDGVSEINISGGYLYVETETGDGIDCNGNINISGGTVISLGALADANGGLDADGQVNITGGTIIATGSMLSGPSSQSTQEAVVASFNATQAAGTLVAIEENGEPVVVFAPNHEFQQFLYSSADLKDGVSYDVYTDGSASGNAVDGLYSTDSYTPGTLSSTITTESASNSGMRGPGGPQGMMQGGPPGGPQSLQQNSDQATQQNPDQTAQQGSPPDMS